MAGRKLKLIPELAEKLYLKRGEEMEKKQIGSHFENQTMICPGMRLGSCRENGN